MIGEPIVFGSRAHLAALFPPVAGVFTLPSGIYIITGEIALTAGEYIVTATSSTVTIYGKFGVPGRLIGNTSTDLLVCGASGGLQLIFCRISNTGSGRALDFLTNSGGRIVHCFVSSTSGVAMRAGGFVQSVQSRYAGLTQSVALTNEMWSDQDTYVGGTTAAIDVSGSGVLRIAGGYVGAGTGGKAIQLNTTGYLRSTATFWIGSTGNVAVDLIAAESCEISGGIIGALSGTANPGFRVAGNCDSLVFTGGIKFNFSSVGLLYASGTIGTAKMECCTFDSSSTQGISWAAANIPTRGLIEMGNSFNLSAANAFVNHTASDARVMRRANTLASGAFASETAAVP